MNIQTSEQLVLVEIAKMLDAEHLIAYGLEEMVDNVTTPELKAVLAAHQAQTQQHINNLESIFEAYDLEPRRIESAAADGLIREYRQTMFSITSPEIMDLATALAAQRVEHFEIGAYQTLIAAAEEFGQGQFTGFLRRNLRQEEQMLERLDRFVQSAVPAAEQQ